MKIKNTGHLNILAAILISIAGICDFIAANLFYFGPPSWKWNVKTSIEDSLLIIIAVFLILKFIRGFQVISGIYVCFLITELISYRTIFGSTDISSHLSAFHIYMVICAFVAIIVLAGLVNRRRKLPAVIIALSLILISYAIYFIREIIRVERGEREIIQKMIYSLFGYDIFTLFLFIGMVLTVIWLWKYPPREQH